MLDILRSGERTAGELVMSFRLSQPAVAFHLRVLLIAGLIRQRRRGRQRLYTLQGRQLMGALRWLERYRGCDSA